MPHDNRVPPGRPRPIFRQALSLLPLIALAACSGPSMEGNILFGRGVNIENTDTTAFTIERIVANGSAQDSNCNNYPNRTLAPGDSYTAVILLCGTIRNLEVITNRGTTYLEVR